METAEIQVKRCSPLYFEPMPNLSKTLEGLLTPLVITVSVCYMSGSKVKERKGESCVFVCLFLCSTLLNISISEHLVPS